MDKILEKRQAEQVRRGLAQKLKELNFKRTKPTFYTQVQSDRIDFIHLHKFTFGPIFRVHIGSRFLCDTFDAVALNGPNSDKFKKAFVLEYDETGESVPDCVNQMMMFIIDVGMEWFDEWSKPLKLLNSSRSPIWHFKEDYAQFLGGERKEGILALSYRLLGIKASD